MDILEKSIQNCKIPLSRGFGNSKVKINAIDKAPMTALLTPRLNIKTRIYETSAFTKKYPDILNMVQDIVKQFDPLFNFNCIQVNKNFQTLPHLDARNTGESIIFAVGDYTGGRLFVEGDPIDIYKKPFKMNGSLHKHWTEWFLGDRYSFICFTNNRM